MAVRDINAAGGINGRKLSLVIADDAGDPARSSIIMRKLARSGVAMVVGGWGSSQVLANLEIAEVSGMPYIVVGATNPRITSKRNAWTFRVIPSDRSLVKQLLQVAQAQGHQNLSVIHDSTAYGRGSRDLLLTFLEERGIKPAVVQSYEPPRRDFTRHLQRIKELGPTDALVVFGTLPAVPLIIQQARAMGIKMPFLGTGGLANEALLTLPPDITRETVIAGFFSEDADTESVAWSQRFEREFANAKSPVRPVLAAWGYRDWVYARDPSGYRGEHESCPGLQGDRAKGLEK